MALNILIVVGTWTGGRSENSTLLLSIPSKSEVDYGCLVYMEQPQNVFYRN